MRLWTTTLVLFPATLWAATLWAATSWAAQDNYWAIQLAAEFAYQDGHEEFLRTRRTKDAIEIFDMCDTSNKPAATAKTKEELTAEIQADGQLRLTTNGRLFALGRPIVATKCTNHIPDKIKHLAPRTSERSFAALTGPQIFLQAAAATLPTTRIPEPAALPTVAPTKAILPNGDDYMCNRLPLVQRAVRPLKDVPTLGPNAAIYPGALLQGKAFQTGHFAPITIEREGGTIFVEGITVKQVTAKVPHVSADFVNAAVVKLARQNSLGTAANIAFPAPQVVYNSDQLAYSLGVDGRFLNGLDHTIHIDPNSNKNYVLAKFTQTYFTASFEYPSDPYSVFADGEDFDDDEGQIASDNPPLLVDTVGYGRNIYFLVASDHDASAVSEALTSAERSGSGDATAISKGVPISYKRILQESTVSYFVQGGEALATLGHVGQISGVGDMYAAIKKAIADAKVAQLTDLSKGLPVSYSLRYLASGEPPLMGFATSFYETQCSTQSKQFYSFTLNLLCIDKSARITAIGPSGHEEDVWSGNGPLPKYINLDEPQFPKSKDSYILRLQLFNNLGSNCLDFQLLRSAPGSLVSPFVLDDATGRIEKHPKKNVINAGASWGRAGWISDYRIQLNRSSGAVSVTQGR